MLADDQRLRAEDGGAAGMVFRLRSPRSARALALGSALTMAGVVLSALPDCRQGPEFAGQTTGCHAAREFAPHATDATSGHAVFAEIEDLPLAEREARILAEIDAGNVPGHRRRTTTVELPAVTAGRRRTRVEVLADYLAIGSDSDFVRVPLTPSATQRVADRYGYVLPTTRIVDAIHAAAEIQQEPRPLTEAREGTATLVQHNDLVADQLSNHRCTHGRLVSGIKKDVVITPRLAERADRVAIYGWHRAVGDPIQPLYVGHASHYVDYSHGVRLLRRTVRVGSEEFDIGDLLSDPVRHVFVSDEGPIARRQQYY